MQIIKYWSKYHNKPVFSLCLQYCVVFNKEVIASGSSDSTVRIWNHSGQFMDICLFFTMHKVSGVEDNGNRMPRASKYFNRIYNIGVGLLNCLLQ